MMENLTASDSRDNESVEGFGYKVKEHGPRKDRNLELNNINGVTDRLTVCFKPLCGLLNQNKLISLADVQSLSLELELVDNALEPLFNVDTTAIKVGIEQDVFNDFTFTNTSTEWQIEQVQVKCDVISLDTQLQNSYT